MKIAHISDLHLSGSYKRKNISALKRVIKHALENGADHFVFTGDIADNAEENDFLLFRKILERFNLLSSDKTSIVIGNHDIFGGAQTAEDVVNFPYRCLKTNYAEKVKLFTSFFKELFVDTVRPGTNEFFPYAKELRNTVLFGVNSIDRYSRIKNPFASNGRVSREQKEKLTLLLEQFKSTTKKKILMIHHHFYKKKDETATSESALWDKIESYTMKLRGKKKLFKIFQEGGIELVLHGHSHEIRDYQRKGIRFLNAGASIEGKTKIPSYFIIDDESLHDGKAGKSFSVELKSIPGIKEAAFIRQQKEFVLVVES